MVVGHHLHPFAEGLLLFDCGDGLVQSTGDFLGIVEYTRRRFLRIDVGRGASRGNSGGIQLRPGLSVYLADFIGRLLAKGISISMDGKGRAFDNILTERLWRTVKYEEVYLKEYRGMAEARKELG